jgi:hypothetical protein
VLQSVCNLVVKTINLSKDIVACSLWMSFWFPSDGCNLRTSQAMNLFAGPPPAWRFFGVHEDNDSLHPNCRIARGLAETCGTATSHVIMHDTHCSPLQRFMLFLNTLKAYDLGDNAFALLHIMFCMRASLQDT